MKALKLQMLFLCIICILFINYPCFSQSISSKTSGGRWSDASTWNGGVVPSAANDVTINGKIYFGNGDGSCRDITINAGAVLCNASWYASPEQIITINGNITNNGTVSNDAGHAFALKVKGSITNNGTWSAGRTELTGSGTQTLTGAAGSRFEGPLVVDATAKPSLAAASALAFNSTLDLGKSTLDMKNYTLTLTGSGANIYNGTVNNAKDILGKTADYTSPSYPVIDNITWSGSINLKGRLRFNTSVTLSGNITVTDTIENSTGYAHPEKKITITGNLINNGIIRNGGSAGFAVNLSGNLTNNGRITINRIELSGKNDQLLSLASGKTFESPLQITDSLGFITAATDLSFNSWFNLNKTVLDMKSHSLFLISTGANVSNGIVMNAKDIIGKASDYVQKDFPVIENIIYDGNVNLKGILRINYGVLMRGEVTVTDTLQNSTGYAHPEKTLRISGSLINNGVIRDGSSAGFVLDVTGNITANKNITNKRVQLSGAGIRTINDQKSQLSYISTGEKVILSGQNFLPNLSVGAGSKCILANGASIYVPENNIDENLDNWGSIPVTRKYSTAQNYTYFKARINVTSNNAIDSVCITSYGHQVPASFSNAVKSYWRVSTYSKSGTKSFSSLSLIYGKDVLGSNEEAKLQVYNSQDSGKTWKQISTTLNTTRDPGNKSITILDAPSSGDYLLSSSPDPTSVRPSIILSIIGRTQIRVGPPNTYTMSYVNNSDVETGDMMMMLTVNGGIHIKQIEPSLPAGAAKQIIPMDSLTYDPQDTLAILWITSMAPREERNFNVVLTAMPDASNSGTSLRKITFLPFVILAVEWAGTAIVAKYTADMFVNVGKELWRPVSSNCKSIWTSLSIALGDAVGKTNYEWFGFEKPYKAVCGKAVGELRKKIGIPENQAVAWGKTIYKAGKGQFEGMRDYAQGTSEVIDCEGNSTKLNGEISQNNKTAQKVTSWDPNEKIGPSGVGDKKFIPTAGKMNYQVLFENKKEATAPAWRILITDTLRSEFDPETFEFGKTSHDGPQYNWKKTRLGNIVTWEIEGIELPPNVIPPEGEGWVAFSVNAKAGLASGSKLVNSATIVFDFNKPIMTNLYSNTLDCIAPTTVMKPLSVPLQGNQLVVRWQAKDETNGSGVESVTLYASKDSSIFEPVGTTSADSMVVSLDQATRKYIFYALSKDLAGNVEQLRPAPLSYTATTGTSKEIKIPAEYSLSQNYPNPFNPETTIEFSVPAQKGVTLKIYNYLGQEVETLVDKKLNAGTYKIIWNAKNIASGIYFYRLQTGDYNKTRKLLLLK